MSHALSNIPPATSRLLPVVAACTAVLLGVLAGCGGGDPESAIAAVNRENIQRLANLYYAYQMKHEMNGPRDEEAFKTFLRGYNPEKLTRIGVDPAAIDELFVSERDGQPFKIRYGVRGSMMGSTEPVIFEAEGKGGRRMVGFLNMVQREVDEAEYNDLWEGRIPPAENPRSVPGGR